MLESTIKMKVFNWAEAHGVLHAKLERAGYPDDIFFVPGGRPLLLEFKIPGEAPRPLQAYILKQLAQRGYDVAWTDDPYAAIAMLEKRMK